jgi:Transposase IS66 family
VREVLAALVGAALSVGTLVNLVRQGAERLQGTEDEIKMALRWAPVLHHDETGLRVVGAEGARLAWTQVTCTPTLTHYARHPATPAIPLVARPPWKPLGSCRAIRECVCTTAGRVSATCTPLVTRCATRTICVR